VYVYVYVCMCVCVSFFLSLFFVKTTGTQSFDVE